MKFAVYAVVLRSDDYEDDADTDHDINQPSYRS